MSRILDLLALAYKAIRIYAAIPTLYLKLRLCDTEEEANLNKYERILFDGYADRLKEMGKL